MSTVILPSPTVGFAITRTIFRDENDLIVWKGKLYLDEKTQQWAEDLELGTRIEVTGKWSTYTNQKGKPSISILIETIEPEDPSKRPKGMNAPREKRYNYEESEESLMLQKLTHEAEIAKIERKVVKTRRVVTADDGDNSDGGTPDKDSSNVASSSARKSPGSSSSGGAPPPTTKSKQNGAIAGYTGTKKTFGKEKEGNSMDTS
ncbi:hypothetical protein BG003_005867 [Podila horticola]|nr:hypothetical protein BG003_005867 [Podila horticola]